MTIPDAMIDRVMADWNECNCNICRQELARKLETAGVAELIDALKPFAAFIDKWNDKYRDKPELMNIADDTVMVRATASEVVITIGDYRRANATLAKIGAAPDDARTALPAPPSRRDMRDQSEYIEKYGKDGAK